MSLSGIERAWQAYCSAEKDGIREVSTARLDEFLEGRLEEEAEFVADCRRHFEGYPRYLSRLSEFGSCAEYLEKAP